MPYIQQIHLPHFLSKKVVMTSCVLNCNNRVLLRTIPSHFLDLSLFGQPEFSSCVIPKVWQYTQVRIGMMLALVH